MRTQHHACARLLAMDTTISRCLCLENGVPEAGGTGDSTLHMQLLRLALRSSKLSAPAFRYVPPYYPLFSCTSKL
jgi:hypothetical protein